MSMQKGKHQAGQTQGYPQRFSHASPFIPSRPTQPRPDVNFHVPSAGFPQQQGGAGPPNVPQLRAIHHPHHSGNPAIPPQHQPRPPQQAQSQHPGGPQGPAPSSSGPAPTSTPPGPSEMGKQGAPQMQGQPPMQQDQWSPLNPEGKKRYGRDFLMELRNNPLSKKKPENLPDIKGILKDITDWNSMPQMQRMYGQGVMPTQIPTPQMFVPSQLPVFAGQPRHQNHAGSGYYQQTAPQQILLAPPVYPGFQHPGSSAQYYYQSPVGIPRPSGGVTGAPSKGGLGGTANQQVMAGSPPPTQMGQPGGPVALGIVRGPGGVVGVGGLGGESSAGPTATSLTAGKQTRRWSALNIVDPKTMKIIDVYEDIAASSSTPPRSGDSSARDTPQPNTAPGAMDVAAEFAALVTKAFVDSSHVVKTVGPDSSDKNSIPAPEFTSPGSIHTPEQRSPVNPEGKKRYGRDFLMELRNDPLSKKKPENLPDIKVLLKEIAKCSYFVPRRANRSQFVNMQPNNAGQQIFSQHFAGQPRHQNHAGSGYYQQTAPQQILMAPQVYPGFQHPGSSAQYYYQSPVGIPRPSGGVTGATSQGALGGTANQQVMSQGPPTAQLGQPGGPVALGIARGPRVAGMGGLGGESTAGPTATSLTAGKQRRRKFAFDIVDTRTKKNVDIYVDNVGFLFRRFEARRTPQPNTGHGAMDVAAEFAALVAKAYVDSSHVVKTVGPDSSDTNSIPASECMSPGSIHTAGEALPVSKQKCVDVEESSNITRVAPFTISPVTGTPPAWKQGQLPHLTSVSLSSKLSGGNSKSDVSSQSVTDDKFGQAILEFEQQVVDFVPSVSAAELNVFETLDLFVKNSVKLIALKGNANIYQYLRRKPPQNPDGAFIVPQAKLEVEQKAVDFVPSVSAAELKVSESLDLFFENLGKLLFLKHIPSILQSLKWKQPQNPDGASIVPQAKLEVEQQMVDFLPSVSAAELKVSESLELFLNNLVKLIVLKHKASIHQSLKWKQPQNPDGASNVPQAKLEVEQQVVDFVSSVSAAELNVSEALDLYVKNLEKLIALKLNAPIHQSPRREQPQHPDGASIVSEATTVTSIPSAQSNLPPVVAASRDTPAVETKVSKKPASTEELTGTDRDKSPTKEAITSPSPAVPVTPAVATAASQPQPERPPFARATGIAEEIQQQTDGKGAAADVTEDQWSPLNPAGKKRYGRDFLMELKNNPLSKKKPENLPDIKAILKDITNWSYFPPLGPAPRRANSSQVVNMQPNNAGQQIFSQHVTMLQEPRMYGQGVMPTQLPASSIFVPSQIYFSRSGVSHAGEKSAVQKEQKPMAARNEENTKLLAAAVKVDTSSFTSATETIPMTRHTKVTLRQMYKEDQWSPLNPEGKKRYGRNFLMELRNNPLSKKKPENLPDIKGILKDNTNWGVRGATNQGGLGGTGNQPVMAGSLPPAQLGQPGGPVALGIAQGRGGVVGVGGLGGESTAGPKATSLTAGKQRRRKFALDTVDAETLKNVDIYEDSAVSSSRPPRSGDSSSRDTPQPNTGPGAMDVAAEFAAFVAKEASEKSSPSTPSIVSQTAYVESSHLVTTVGPDLLDIYSIPDPEVMPPSSNLTSGNALPFSK